MSSPTNPTASQQDAKPTQTSTPTFLPKGEFLRRLGPAKPATTATSTTPSKQPLTPPSSPYQSAHGNDNLMTPSTIKNMSVDEIVASYSKAREEKKPPAFEEQETQSQVQIERPAHEKKRAKTLQEAASLRYPSTRTRKNVKREFADLTGDEDDPVAYRAITEDEARRLSGLPPKEYVFPSLLDLLQD